MLLVERDTPEGLLVAVCDEDALGETYADGELSLTVTEEFYGGEPADEAAVVDALARAQVANIVGPRSVAVAVEHGIVDEATVLEVDGTRHAQMVRL
jgi:hypothetical protein